MRARDWQRRFLNVGKTQTLFGPGDTLLHLKKPKECAAIGMIGTVIVPTGGQEMGQTVRQTANCQIQHTAFKMTLVFDLSISFEILGHEAMEHHGFQEF
jgi:hypothetical protein